MANTFKFGNKNWAWKEGSVLAFNDENNNFKPLPFDFTRSSSATRVNKDGLIEVVGSDEPRVDYLNNADGHLLLEPSRSNNILYSEDINTYWTNSGSPTKTTNIAIAPDGQNTADGIEDTTGSGFKSIRQEISVSPNSTYTGSLFVKKVTSETNYMGLSLYYLGGATARLVYGLIDAVNGTIVNATESTLTPVFKVEDYGDYWRFCVTATDNGSNTSLRFMVYACLSTDGISIGTGIGSLRTIWGAQLEAGSYATSYIPTSGSSVTRADDTFNQDGWQSKGILDSSKGTLFLDLQDCFSKDGTEIVYQFVDSSDNPIFRLYFEQAGECSIFSIYNNINSEFTKSNFVLTSSPKIAIVYDGTSRLDIFGNGEKIVKSGSNLSSNAAIDGFTDVLSVNYNKTGFKEIKLYNTALTDSELIALTSN